MDSRLPFGFDGKAKRRPLLIIPFGIGVRLLLLNPILPTFIFPLYLKDAFVNELFEVVAGS